MDHVKEQGSRHSGAGMAEEDSGDLLRAAWAEAAGRDMTAESPSPDPVFPAEDAVRETPDTRDARIAELQDQLLRSVAETENVRRRAQRDVEEAGKYAITPFAREIVGVCDNLQRAADAISPEARQGGDLLATVAQGVDMTLRELLNVLDRFRVERVDPLGTAFDHNLHQAVAQIEHAEAEPGTVLQVMQPGYTLHGRLLRPAMVGVAKRPEAPPSPPPADIHIDTQA